MTGNRHTAEDLVQEVFLRILKYRATYRDGARFETWVFRIARNARADYYSGREAVGPLTEEAMDSPDATPGPTVSSSRSTNRRDCRPRSMSLREDRRELILLARYQGMKHEAIAELLGIDVGAVKVRIHRALKELREIFCECQRRQHAM